MVPTRQHTTIQATGYVLLNDIIVYLINATCVSSVLMVHDIQPYTMKNTTYTVKVRKRQTR